MNNCLGIKNLTLVAEDGLKNQRKILENLSFSIAQGEIVAVLGESGCGKSTLALTILGADNFARVEKGQIFYADKDLLYLSRKEREKLWGWEIALLTQNVGGALNPSFKIGKQLRDVIKYRENIKDFAEGQARVLGLLARVGLNADICSYYPYQLSGGMKQRVLLTMILACHPRLLLADEPTTGLDKLSKKEILDLLLNICRREKMAILLITHDKEAADYLAARKVLIAPNMLRSGSDKLLINSYKEKKEIMQVSGVSKIFLKDGKRGEVVRDISFTVSSAEILSLVGESGSGKSTLGKMIARLLPVTQGQIRWLGKDIMTYDKKELYGKLQIVFQDSLAALNKKMTVGKILEEPLRIHDKVGKTSELLNLVGLSEDLLSRYPAELSGGQCRRVVLARSLALQPELLIADEITNGLDPITKDEILNLLLRMKHDLNMSIIFISHDLNAVKKIADYVGVMRFGELIEYGCSEDIFLNSHNSYVNDLICQSF